VKGDGGDVGRRRGFGFELLDVVGLRAADTIRPMTRGIAAVLLLLTLTACTASNTTMPGAGSLSYTPPGEATAPARTAAPTQPTAPVGIGMPARDGTLEFVVHDIRRAPTAGNPTNKFEQVRANGEFIIIDLTVKNIGHQPQSYYTDSQTLVVAGKQHSADILAAVYLAPESASPINPGLAIDIATPFDVPVGSQPDAIILNDIADPGGVTVNLAGAPIATS
jgi:hypothetical protein